MKCLICNRRNAVKVDPFGYLPCLPCRRKMQKIVKPRTTTEVTTESIKEDRKKYATDLTQPFRGGQLSKEYVEAHPDRVKEMVKEGHVTQKEIVSAKNIWDLNYYKDE